MKIHLDIETGDPDDLFTLSMISTHPEVELIGVSVFPGGLDQIGLVRKVLDKVGMSKIPIGANIKDDGKSRVSKFYNRWLGSLEETEPDMTAVEVINNSLKNGATTLLTGGPLTNIEKAFIENNEDKLFSYWTCQGGFVGDSLVPKGLRLSKFDGMETIQTFNLNGNPKAALKLLNSNSFNTIRMVGKNVCHGFTFNKHDIQKFKRGKHDGLDLMLEGLEVYFKKRDCNKALHDNLAAILAINPDLGTWVRGMPFREKGKWGFKASDDSSIEALIAIDREDIINEF